MKDIEPDSPSGRIATHLRANPKARLDRSTIAQMLAVAPAAVDKLLTPGVEAGLITVAHDGDLGRIWTPGRLIQSWPARGSSTAADKSTAKRKVGKREAPDPTKIQIISGTPLPPKSTGVGAVSAYDVLLEKMKVGDHVQLPEVQARSMSSRAHRRDIPVALRVVRPGIFGVWRLAVAEKKGAAA